MIDKKANEKTNKRIIRNNHQFYSILKDIVIPVVAIVISIFAVVQSYKARKISEQAAIDVRTNNEIINSYTVNLNKPTFNFGYHYGESKDVITGLNIENEGTSLSTYTIQLYPYLEVLVKNNNSEEDLIQQDDLLFPNEYLFDTILVPVGKDIFGVEYKNNRTGLLATIYQSPLYEKLIKDIEECDEMLPGGEKIVSIRLKCFIELKYKDLNDESDKNDEDVEGSNEKEIWNTGYVKKCSDAEYYKTPDENVGVIKLEENEMSDFNYVINVSTGRFLPESRENLIDAIDANRGVDRSGYITLEVKKPDQLQWSKTVIGKPGDIVIFRIQTKNTTYNQIDNWRVRIIVPTNIEYIEGKTIVANTIYPDYPKGYYVSDKINTEDGMNIGSYSQGGNAFIYFYVRIGKEAQNADKNMIYRMIAQCSAGHETGTIEDIADVIVETE